jgi:hypothetical protein
LEKTESKKRNNFFVNRKPFNSGALRNVQPHDVETNAEKNVLFE